MARRRAFKRPMIEVLERRLVLSGAMASVREGHGTAFPGEEYSFPTKFQLDENAPTTIVFTGPSGNSVTEVPTAVGLGSVGAEVPMALNPKNLNFARGSVQVSIFQTEQSSTVAYRDIFRLQIAPIRQIHQPTGSTTEQVISTAETNLAQAMQNYEVLGEGVGARRTSRRLWLNCKRFGKISRPFSR